MHTGRKGMKWGQHIFTKDELKFANGKRNYEGGYEKAVINTRHNYKTSTNRDQKSESDSIYKLNKAIAAKQSHMSYADKLRNSDEWGYRTGRKLSPKLTEINAKYHEDIARVAIQNGKRIADELFANKVKLEEYNREYGIIIERSTKSHTYGYGEQRYFYNPAYQTKRTNRMYYYD